MTTLDTDKIGALIAPLLRKNQTIALPGLGSFQTGYRPAVTDQVQGEVHPPGADVRFNPNLVANDGVLANAAAAQFGLSHSEAEAAVKAYVDGLVSSLERQEIVVLPEVGRLYRDFEKQLQFLPGQTNFSEEAFGLPTLSYSPVVRAEASGKVGPQGAKKAAPVTRKPQQKQQFSNYGLIGIIALAFVVVVFAVYALLFNGGNEAGQAAQALPGEERLNVKPGQVEPQAESGAGGDMEGQMPTEETPPPADATEAPQLPPNEKTYVIVVGVFGNPENVNRLVKQIYDAGYAPYTEKEGGLTRVGIERTYTTEDEIDEALREIRAKFTPDAKIYKW
ncbi:HU domain-containing protein [Phaeodactylibacter luteus]|uniref:SPOR domain-containing protein n=1 Tax=Phaeodactylibacter luteus TaxID=1564516 RepID=A0A5C6RH98_9BACT|nr:SPOR domain-containing protein [Phaeodactylibacter luteus]TXB61299.1 hypothetical protein FRY97_19910 [Phaeodactylibacter luteus]